MISKRLSFVWVLTISLCVLVGTAIAQPSKTVSRTAVVRQLEDIFNPRKLRNARSGVMVVQAGTTDTLYVQDGQKSFVPASNMKLYTTAAAIDTLGADWQYETKFMMDGKLTRGTLNGNLVIVGSGDPSLSGRYLDTQTTAILRNIAKELKAAGLRRVSGNLVGDDSYFREGYAPTWPWADAGEWYSTVSGALAVNDNCWDVLIYPGRKVGDKATVKVLFPTDGVLTFVCDVTTTGSEADGGKPSINIDRALDGNKITLTGSVPVGSAPYKEWGSVRYGGRMAVNAFAQALRAEGISISGKSVLKSEVEKPRTETRTRRGNREQAKALDLPILYTHKSPPLSRLIRIVNKPSQNFYADMVCRTLDRQQGGNGSWGGCERVVEKWLRQRVGADTYGFVMCDGSGLSRRGMVRPDLTVALLQHLDTVSAPANRKAFYDSLPIAGVDGTIASRMKRTAAAGNCHAKTGFIGAMRALSGYVDDKSGRRWVFSMMTNNFVIPVAEVNAAQDKAVELLANLEGELID